MAEELVLQRLPQHRFIDYTELTVKVMQQYDISEAGIIYRRHRASSVKLSGYLYHDRLACFVGQTRVITLPRVYPSTAQEGHDE